MQLGEMISEVAPILTKLYLFLLLLLFRGCNLVTLAGVCADFERWTVTMRFCLSFNGEKREIQDLYLLNFQDHGWERDIEN